MKTQVLIEAVVVGFMLSLFALIIPRFLTKLQLAGVLFIVGALFHLICEVTGINRYYCKSGAACS